MQLRVCNFIVSPERTSTREYFLEIVVSQFGGELTTLVPCIFTESWPMKIELPIYTVFDIGMYLPPPSHH